MLRIPDNGAKSMDYFDDSKYSWCNCLAWVVNCILPLQHHKCWQLGLLASSNTEHLLLQAASNFSRWIPNDFGISLLFLEFCIIRCKLSDSTTAMILTKAHFSPRLTSKDYRLAFAKRMCSSTKHGRRCSDYFIRALNCIKITEGAVVCSG
jgi:hypothetical protein